MTIAEKISDRMFGGWTTENGHHLQDICKRLAVNTRRGETGTDRYTHYRFRDDSAIVIVNDFWDVGFAGCLCSRGVNNGRHGERCAPIS